MEEKICYSPLEISIKVALLGGVISFLSTKENRIRWAIIVFIIIFITQYIVSKYLMPKDIIAVQ